MCSCWRMILWWRLVRLLRRVQRPDIRDQFPDLIRRELGAPRRHARRPAFEDRGVELGVGATVRELARAQTRAHPAAGASAMTSRAVVLHEQLATFGGRARVVHVRVVEITVLHGRVIARYDTGVRRQCPGTGLHRRRRTGFVLAQRFLARWLARNSHDGNNNYCTHGTPYLWRMRRMSFFLMTRARSSR